MYALCSVLAAPAHSAPLRPGASDPTFGVDGWIALPGFTSLGGLAVQQDGRVLATGARGTHLAVARLMPDGRLDRAFGSGGVAEVVGSGTSEGVAVLVQPDGAIVAGGTVLSERGSRSTRVVRLTEAGALDPQFATDGVASLPEPLADLALQPDGRLLVAVDVAHPGVWRLGQDGAPDPSFGRSGRADVDLGHGAGHLEAVALQSDGSIVVAGWWDADHCDGPYCTTVREAGLARLRPTGSADPSFGAEGVVQTWDEWIGDLAIQPDDHIVAGAGGWSAARRFEPDGAPDPAFGTGGYAEALATSLAVDAVALQPDGAILVVGGRPEPSVIRYRPDGGLDRGFGGGAARLDRERGTGDAWTLAALDDGRVVVGGRSGFVGQYLTEDAVRLDLRVNGDAGPVVLRSGAGAVVAASIEPGVLAGTPHEVWLVAQTPQGPFSYVWASRSWQPGTHALVSGPLVRVVDAVVFDAFAPDEGVYHLTLQVDDVRDGVQGPDAYSDSVVVMVAPP